MNVVKKGKYTVKKDEFEKMKVICKHCGAEIEITPMDVKSALFGNKRYFMCPECLETITVRLRKATPNFRHWVKYYSCEV